MVNFMFLIFGLIDFIAGIILTFTAAAVLPEIARFIGLFLIGKGIWTMVTSFMS